MPSWLQPEELHIDHVGDPGQGMPVSGMAGGDCPEDPLHGKAVPNVPVLGDVLRIIKRNEIAARDLPEGREGGDDEKQGDYEQAFFCCHGTAGRDDTVRTLVGDLGAQADAGFFCRRCFSCRCFLAALFIGRAFWCSLSFVLHGSLRPAFPGIETCSPGFTCLAFFQYTSTRFSCQTDCWASDCWASRPLRA